MLFTVTFILSWTNLDGLVLLPWAKTPELALGFPSSEIMLSSLSGILFENIPQFVLAAMAFRTVGGSPSNRLIQMVSMATSLLMIMMNITQKLLLVSEIAWRLSRQKTAQRSRRSDTTMPLLSLRRPLNTMCTGSGALRRRRIISLASERVAWVSPTALASPRLPRPKQMNEKMAELFRESSDAGVGCRVTFLHNTRQDYDCGIITIIIIISIDGRKH